MATTKNSKATPVTVGLLLVLGSLIFGAVSFLHRGEKEVKQIVKETILQHVEKDVDISHPQLPRRYVSKEELGDQMHKVDKKLDKIEMTQKIIIERLPEQRITRSRRRTTRNGN